MTPPSLGWADARALDGPPAPLALYEPKWSLTTGPSDVPVELPTRLHAFTMQPWECALGPELRADVFADGAALIRRTRKLVCTHETGATVQTELACAYAIPSLPEEGSPARSRQEAHLALGGAPPLMLACNPTRVERLELFDANHASLGKVCVVAGRVQRCP